MALAEDGTARRASHDGSHLQRDVIQLALKNGQCDRIALEGCVGGRHFVRSYCEWGNLQTGCRIRRRVRRRKV
ncbi:hypothetical protein D9M72_554510 [compost metagenome]